MDLSKLRELQSNAKDEIDEMNSRNNNNNNENRIKLLYPFHNGTFRIKLLFDEKSGMLQRKVIRHKSGAKKVPCLAMYGEECPVCQKINEIQEVKGRECGVFGKYGYNTKGICKAVLMDDSEGLFKESKVEKGEEILFMYPISLYNQINELIVKSGDNIESLLATNLGKTVEIKRSQKGNGPIDYTASVYPYGDEKVRETDEEFEKLINEMQVLNDQICPSHPTEAMRDTLKALVETINEEFMLGNVINPNDESSVNNSNKTEENKDNGKPIANNTQEQEKVDKPVSNPEPAMNPPVEETKITNQSSSDVPECYGKHSGDAKCNLCVHEVECLMNS